MGVRTPLVMVAGLAVVGAAAWAISARSAGGPEVEVRTVALSRGPIVHRVVAAGTIEAASTVDVGAQVSGVIQSLEADFNSVVRRGQVLATLDPSTYQALLARARATRAQAQADVVRLQAELVDASTKLDRARELAEAGLATKADLETAQTTASQASADLKAAESSVVVAQASLDSAQVNLDYTVIRSPIDGIVVARQVEVGQTVAVRQTIPVFFTIAEDFRHLTLEEGVDESDVSYVRPGQVVTFSVSAFPDETFEGVVSHARLQPDQEATVTELPNGLLRSREPRVITYTVVVDIDNPNEQLRPGMTAIGTIVVTECESCMRVPNDALAFKPSQDVFTALDQQPMAWPDAVVADEEGPTASLWQYDGVTLQPAIVVTGAQGDQFTEIVSGPEDLQHPIVTSARLQTVAIPTAQSPLAPQPQFRRGRRGGFRGFR